MATTTEPKATGDELVALEHAITDLAYEVAGLRSDLRREREIRAHRDRFLGSVLSSTADLTDDLNQ